MSKILIIDDDPRHLFALHTLVSSCNGNEVELASSGAEAVLVAERFQPDLVILDFQMPRMSGSETASFLRAVSPAAHIVAVSAYIDGGADWADGFIRKDHLEELPRLIDLIMKDGHAN